MSEGIITALEYIPALRDHIKMRQNERGEENLPTTADEEALLYLLFQESWLVSQAIFNFDCGEAHGDFDHGRWTREVLVARKAEIQQEVEATRDEIERLKELDRADGIEVD